MNILQWLLIEKQLLSCTNPSDFHFTLLSVLQKTLKCQQAVIYQKKLGKFSIKNAMHVSQIDNSSPLILWLENEFLTAIDTEQPAILDVPPVGNVSMLQQYKKIWHLPLIKNAQHNVGILCFLDNVPSEKDITLMAMMCVNMALLYEKMHQHTQKKWRQIFSSPKKIAIIGLVLLSVMFIKVPQKVLATAEVSPVQPELISASIDGIVKQILVQPDEPVKKNDKLVLLDDEVIKNKLSEAAQEYNVAYSRYLKAYRNAFNDQQSKNEIQLLKNNISQAKIKQTYFEELLSRTVISASKEGIAIFSSPNEFIGKPVRVGQRIMLLADPNDKIIDFWVPIDNVVNIDPTQALVLYSNLQPLNSIEAKLKFINPIAQPMPDGSLGYFGQATFNDKRVTLGEKGTLKLYGEKKSLWLLLFQRPLRFVRQSLGI